MASKEAPHSKNESISFWETVPGILTAIAGLITACGSLIAALVALGVIGSKAPTPQPPLIPTDTPLVHTIQPDATQTPLPSLITITLINNHCAAQDFYVDGVKVATISADSTGSFQSTTGNHKTYSCQPGTLTCGVSADVNWFGSTTQTISRGSSCGATATLAVELITITLANNPCAAQDFYVDGVKVITISADSTDTFESTIGRHETYSCAPGTLNCGASVDVNWLGSTTQSISRGSSCGAPATPAPELITITLANNHCYAQDFYVDGVKVLTISADSSDTFQSTIGRHETYSCLPGTLTCGASVEVNWIGSTTQTISRGTTCP
jgi:hypothetical protein